MYLCTLIKKNWDPKIWYFPADKKAGVRQKRLQHQIVESGREIEKKQATDSRSIYVYVRCAYVCDGGDGGALDGEAQGHIRVFSCISNNEEIEQT